MSTTSSALRSSSSPNSSPEPSLLREAGVCGKVSAADRATLLVDGQEYFTVLYSALQQAQQQILIAGWDFDSRISLLPPSSSGTDCIDSARPPAQLGALLGHLIRRRPGLQIHVVRWRYHWWYRDDREADTRQRLERMGVHFHEDACHPVTGCVHHKLVVIDDALAFCGGMDLTHKRWDTRQHHPHEPGRSDASADSYMPVHDTQLCVSGPIARHLGNYLRTLWPAANPPRAPVGRPHPLWPKGLRAEFRNIRVGLCRTLPAGKERVAVREIEAFYLAAIKRTRYCLYFENQYFTSRRIAQAIAAQCRSQPQLQGLLVGMDRPKTPIESHTMGYGRVQFGRVLAESGAMRRVPLVAAISDGQSINLHSKLSVFDDRWLTVGSANLNHRSMGFDVECNLVLEACTQEHRVQMARLRNTLLAEHLGMTAGAVAAAIQQHGLASLPALSSASRRLVRVVTQDIQSEFGPLLAPLFDRENAWPPSAAIFRLHGWSGALLACALISGAALSGFIEEGLPALTSVQRWLALLRHG